MGTKYARLEIKHIAEYCKIPNKALITMIVQEMITHHEIYAQYFTKSKAVVFDQLKNTADMDKFLNQLDNQFQEWNENGIKKADKIN
jgi:hypothetical protein